MRDTAGSAAAPAARCRKFRRGSFISRTSLTSLDHLVGAGEQGVWHGQAKRLGGLEVDSQLEPRGRLYWQIIWLLTLEDAVDIGGRANEKVGRVRPIRH